MIESRYLHALYERFYKFFRKYVWDFDIVTKLANLEIDLFCTFPDREKCARELEQIRSDIKRCQVEDEDLYTAIDQLMSGLTSEEESYAYIEQF